MFEHIELEKTVYTLKDIQDVQLPSVILCGRSNIGKSSFINSMANRKSLAKTSSTPGKTRSINYYKIDNKFYFVDLPGFGYAKTSKSEREKWAALVIGFIQISNSIKYAFHFIDSRHKPTELDNKMNDLLRYNNISYYFVLNKADKLKQKEKAAIQNQFNSYFPESIINENTFFYSSLKGNLKKPIIALLNKLFY
jgi:GTP-binding protein